MGKPNRRVSTDVNRNDCARAVRAGGKADIDLSFSSLLTFEAGKGDVAAGPNCE